MIGVAQCLDTRGRWRSGSEYLYGDRAYAEAVARAGGLALHLPIQSQAEALVERIDGLLLPGGDDFLPGPGDKGRYPDDLCFDPAPAEQIDFDRALLAAALAADKPVLGICYGMQLLALHLGGDLHHHLPLDLPSCEEHKPAEGEGRHTVLIEPGTRLATVVACERTTVNSRHHQAVADPGPTLRACAHAPDSVIEAVERRGDGAGPLCLGVQWHPEKLAGAAGNGLFRALVDSSIEARRAARSG